MTVKDIIEKLSSIPENLECVIAINQSAGFSYYDHMDIYPIDKVFVEDNILETEPKAIGYWHNEEEYKKVLFYVFP